MMNRKTLELFFHEVRTQSVIGKNVFAFWAFKCEIIIRNKKQQPRKHYGPEKLSIGLANSNELHNESAKNNVIFKEERVLLWMKFTSIFWPKIDCLKFDLITTLTSMRDLPTSLTNGMTLNGKLISFVVRYLRGENTRNKLIGKEVTRTERGHVVDLKQTLHIYIYTHTDRMVLQHPL